MTESFDLAEALPRLLPRAIVWAELHSAEIQATGVSLNPSGLAIARAVGVVKPEHIRVSIVPSLPLPEDPELRDAALQTGLLGPTMVGVTLGYSIYLVKGYVSTRLLSHECRHVFQYETAGSIAAFLPVYLAQIAEYGYDGAPLEIDAQNHERDGA
jgi:hypothetical protein